MEKQQNKLKNRMIKKIALLFIGFFTISVSAQVTEDIDYANQITNVNKTVNIPQRSIVVL